MKGLFIRLDDETTRVLNEVCRREGYQKTGLITKLIRDFANAAEGDRGGIRKAEEFGIDMSLIEENLKKSPTERLRDHARAYAFVEALRGAKRRQKT